MRILLDDHMRKHNLTARQVEILTGIPKSTIYRITNDEVSPKMDTMEQLAKGLKTHINDLFESDYK